jgi:hypothetical protein
VQDTITEKVLKKRTFRVPLKVNLYLVNWCYYWQTWFNCSFTCFEYRSLKRRLVLAQFFQKSCILKQKVG